MRHSRAMGVVVLAGLVFTCGILATWMLSSAAERGRKAKAKIAAKVPPKGDEQATTATLPSGLVTLRVDLRSKGKVGAKQPTAWDGQLTVSRGRLLRIRSWFDDPRDMIEANRWQLTTRRSIPWSSAEKAKGHAALPLKDSALVIELAETDSETELKFETAQGNFAFKLAEVPFGTTKSFLGGLVGVSRMASAVTMLSAPTEDDYPSAARGPDGKLYVAYQAFTHGKDFRARFPIDKEPDDLKFLAQPTGGDQVLLIILEGDRWTGPLAVSPPGQDVFRAALAVDGSGGVWVFWSAGREGNWDIYGRCYRAGTWSPELRLTTAPEPDAFPAAATDSSGRVWLAWQAFRASNSDILAARQEGDRFGEPMTIANSPANEWAPAIAASTDGQVAFAWDTYEKGDYDVYCRVWSGGKLGDRVAVATSLEAEMRPSVTFDGSNQLWIAYENSPEKWGKDWGALEKEGVALYQGRTVAVRVLSKGQLMQPADDPASAFVPAARTAKPQARRPQQLALPRLATDAKGRVWLGVRSARLGTRVAVGPVWFEHLAWYEGERWSNEIVCPGTDNILDNAPALVPLPSGEMLLVGSSDGRMATSSRLPPWFIKELRAEGEKLRPASLESRWPDPVNNELTLARFGPAPGATPLPAKLLPVNLQTPAPSPDGLQEANAVARARQYRVTIAGKTLRLLRGEFHRHTELSQDGGGDGMLMDMWRYGLDAAAQDWIGNGDHDNGDGREYSWWITQKTTELFHIPGVFSPMYTYERSCNYPDGHRNVVFARRGVRTLPRLRGGQGKAMDDLPPEAQRPNSPDTLMLYRYLAEFDGVCASHTSGTDMGTDWRDNNAKVEPVVEIYQGCRQNYEMPGAPRSNTAEYSIGGWRPYGFVSLALKRGYRLGFQASSDHVSTHISYCNVWAEEHSSAAILAAMKARHVYGATDNIIADVRCGEHFMGDEFTLSEKPTLKIRLIGTDRFAKVHVIKDGNYAHTAEPNRAEVELQWTDFAPQAGKTSYYYVRGEQANGELVWVSPMWITYKP